ncbi:MAG: large-conductance mechanosensitive channel protein MscL [Oscillospiraceae bacterium]|nr:large-conductance mechanosensitive channel protein MscL [Oscillospiraceae bacterium]
MKKIKFIEEFKEFVARGNVLDMAIGVVIGGAFKGIVDSLVKDIIMPLVGMITGGLDFSSHAITLSKTIAEDGTEVVNALTYGMFINAIINFVIIAFCLFIVVRIINNFHRKKEEAPAEPEAPAAAEPSAEEKLLTEIRDLLKEDAKAK